MRLKQLGISGFKSFAKHVTLEFPTPIVAIVGPNGSGKSNVAEAIRWVLGEQSMKSLRGKRGEDLIFHGSSTNAQLGKALVKLTFNNSDHVLPVDFDEVVVSREVFRDGTNEYKVNGSLVRLKDIIEMLSKVGIGGSAHHIINQGEADRILYASPKDRRTMLEDALGLKIYEIKRAEAERKLEHTKENIRQVEALRKEIQPHLKFLKVQAEKVETSARIRNELRVALGEYLKKEAVSIDLGEKDLRSRQNPLDADVKRLEQEIDMLWQELSGEREPDEGGHGEIKALEEEVHAQEERRQSLERELGRVEGQLSFYAQKAVSGQASALVPREQVEVGVRSLLSITEEALRADSFEAIRARLNALKTSAEKFLTEISGSEVNEEEALTTRKRLGEELIKLKNVIQDAENERRGLLEKKRLKEAAMGQRKGGIREKERAIREREVKLNTAKDALRALAIEKERLRFRRDEWEREREEDRRFLEAAELESAREAFHDAEERLRLQRGIERLKIKLEEAGGIDESVLKEFKEISERDIFLARELTDLAQSTISLETLMRELTAKLEEEFLVGVKKINAEFGMLFAAMFGGGKAELKIMQEERRHRRKDEDLLPEDLSAIALASAEASAESGVDIAVDLPRKKIKGLDMLSGGERALTSIALLFAMSAVNPPPFLVLDETDAALDEANSQRYGAMLKNLSAKTQLVVITHNRQTMHEAGILYGVTMGADGISKLLSIKLEEAIETARSR